MFRRLRSAYVAAIAALGFGVVLSLLKGLDYEEALTLTTIAAALWISRGEFYRRDGLGAQVFPLRWIAMVAVVLGVSLWVGLVSFHHVDYSDRLWWQFAFEAQAPRMLRASVLAAVSLLVLLTWTLMCSRSKADTPALTEADRSRITDVLVHAQDTSANLALLGDKRLLWSDDLRAFVMYQICGDSWVSMGDPVGPAEKHEELAWAFRELVDRHDGRPVFYQVSSGALFTYVDLGLTLSKLGEDARVPLEGFSLQGSARAELRQAVNRATKQGASFDIVPRVTVPAIVGELRSVSDAWLADTATAEKGFSLGAFSEDYISNFDCAVVRVNSVIVAFGNIWRAAAAGELSIDLMRHTSNAPKGVMDYLFAELMRWGAANGFTWFNLGMAPLAGMEHRALAPVWHKVGHLVFTHAESFYNFEGLRNYKSKFDPVWTPRYLACAGGLLSLPRALLDCSRLISGGIGRTLVK